MLAPAEEMPRIEGCMKAPYEAMTTAGVAFARSPVDEMPALLSWSDESAAIAIGTFRRFSERRWAVTMMSLLSVAASDPASAA